jgi:hypothetical protein
MSTECPDGEVNDNGVGLQNGCCIFLECVEGTSLCTVVVPIWHGSYDRTRAVSPGFIAFS